MCGGFYLQSSDAPISHTRSKRESLRPGRPCRESAACRWRGLTLSPWQEQPKMSSTSPTNLQFVIAFSDSHPDQQKRRAPPSAV